MPDVFILIAVVHESGLHRGECDALKVPCAVLTKFEDVEKEVEKIIAQGYVIEMNGTLPTVESHVEARFFPINQISYFDVFLERRA